MHQVHSRRKSKKLLLAIILNLLITVGQVIGGIVSGSISLISDALHNFSDVMALVISYIAMGLIKKKNTPDRTFGFKRAEIIAAFINASALIAIAIYLCVEAFRRFSQPLEINSVWVMAFAGLSIFLNGLSVIILHRETSTSLNIRSAYVHLLSDMFTSLGVFIGGIIMFYSDAAYWIDGVLTLLIAIYLIYATWSILMESIRMLMLFTPANINPTAISKRICSMEYIDNIHHAHIWQLNEENIHFEAHVNFNENLKLECVDKILNRIRKILHEEYHIDHVTLQPEFNTCHKKDLISQTH